MGVLPDTIIQEMRQAGCIAGIDASYINPASLDMPASDEAYRLEKTFMSREGERVRDMLAWAGATPHDLEAPFEVGVSYLVRLEGALALLDNIYAYANPKSSTGRLNVLARTIADGVAMYDAVPLGWKGELWMLVQPRSFPIRIGQGLALVQMRFFDGKSFLDQTGLGLAMREHGIFFDRHGAVLSGGMRAHADSLFLTIRADEGVVGWACAGSSKVLDLGKKGFYRPEEFSFEPVVAHEGGIVLMPGNFYILTTEESVKVPPLCSAELRAIDPRLGEFRSHAAGFIDPGWGSGKDGAGAGQPITLEITTSEVGKLSLRHGQAIARLRFERMSEAPAVLYGDASSHYVGQTSARLSKHFIRE